jgi:hypothetical protein
LDIRALHFFATSADIAAAGPALRHSPAQIIAKAAHLDFSSAGTTPPLADAAAFDGAARSPRVPASDIPSVCRNRSSVKGQISGSYRSRHLRLEEEWLRWLDNQEVTCVNDRGIFELRNGDSSLSTHSVSIPAQRVCCAVEDETRIVTGGGGAKLETA